MRTFLLLFVSALAALGQTRVTTDSMRAATGAEAAGTVLVITADGRVAIARLEGLVLDMTGPVPVLRVAAPQVQLPVSVDYSVKVAAGGLPVVEMAAAPLVGTLTLYRNGLLQTAGEDYDVLGSVATFRVGAVPQPGDIIRVRYQRATQ